MIFEHKLAKLIHKILADSIQFNENKRPRSNRFTIYTYKCKYSVRNSNSIGKFVSGKKLDDFGSI
jgi:hypothetical protein